MSNVRRRKRKNRSQVEGIARASLQSERVAPIRTAGSLLTSELLAGESVLHRTTTPFASATFGTANSEGVSLVMAARPSAGRSPAAKHQAQCGGPSRHRFCFGSSTHTAGNTTPLCLVNRRRTGLSSGTLPVVNTTPILKVARRSGSSSVSVTKARAVVPPAPPNPAVNRTPHGRPGPGFISFSPKPALPRVAGYLER